MDKEKILAEIDDIALLEEIWDGYGADPISKKIIDKSKVVLEHLNDKYPDPILCPSCYGLQFEWDHGDNGVEVYVEDGGHVSYLKVDGPNIRNWEEVQVFNLIEINWLLNWLYDGE